MPQYNSRVCHPTELANVGPLDEQGGSHPWTPVNYKEMGSRSLVIDQNDIAKLTVDDQKNAWVEFLGFFFFFFFFFFLRVAMQNGIVLSTAGLLQAILLLQGNGVHRL